MDKIKALIKFIEYVEGLIKGVSDEKIIARLEKIISERLGDAIREIRDEVGELRILISMEELDDRFENVMDAFKVKGDIPKLGIEVEEIKED